MHVDTPDEPAPRFKVWITKHALTQGIFETEVESSDRVPGTVLDDHGSSLPVYRWTFYRRNEWHHTREGAAQAAMGMRARKLVSLRRQIAKLEAMEF